MKETSASEELAAGLRFDPEAVLERESRILLDPHFLGALHEELRGLLRSLDELARRAAESDDSCVPALREIGVSAHQKQVAHLDFEDRYLVPAIRDAPPGARR